jgi:hypothetical protein
VSDRPASATEVRRRAVTLLGQLRELLDAAESGELPVGPSYRHRVEGGITALEAVLGLPPSLVSSGFEPSARK